MLALLVALLLCANAAAAPLKIVVVGDSIASRVGRYLQAALDQTGVQTTVNRATAGGATTGKLLGSESERNLFEESLSYEPDIVVLHVGVNNAMQNQQAEFADDLKEILDRYAAQGVKVIVGGLIPVLPHATKENYAAADERIRTFYNPLLEREAQARGLVFVENYRAIQTQRDWRSWYSDDGDTPGYIHLFGGKGAPGYHWLARQYATAIAQKR